MTLDARLLMASAACFAAFLALGYAICRSPLPWPVDLRARALLGQATPLAALFTMCGRAYALAAFAIMAVAAIVALHGSLIVAAAILAAQLCSQALAELAKRRFARKRPDDWIFHKELGYSFPSGHAVTAIVFYGGLVLLVWTLPLPRALRVAATGLLGVWILGIPWSRMALGAHYATDVLAGMLFGAGWLCVMAIVLRHVPAAYVPPG